MTLGGVRGVGLFCFLLLSCSPDEGMFKSGTRLKTRWLVAPDGGRAAVSLHDTEFGFDCTPMKTADGVRRCLPPARNVRFADAACTRAVMSRGEIVFERLTFVSRVASPACGGIGEAFEVAGVVSLNESYVKRDDGTCERSFGVSAYELNRIEDTRLVAFSEKTVELGSLTAVLGTTEDGATAVIETRNTRSTERCALSIYDFATPKDRVVCPPLRATSLGTGGTFSDAACTIPAVADNTAQCASDPGPAPTFITIIDRDVVDGCEQSSVRYHALSGEVTTLYSAAQSGCTQVQTTGSPSQKSFELGAPIEPSALPGAEVAWAGAELKSFKLLASSKTVARGSRLYSDGDLCSVWALPDGTKRCFPFKSTLHYNDTRGARYSDPECKTFLYRSKPSQCGVQPRWIIEANEQNDPSLVKRILTPGPRYKGTSLYFRHGLTFECLPSTASTDDVLYEAGAETTAEEIKVTDVIE